jgi:hypothetical protein
VKTPSHLPSPPYRTIRQWIRRPPVARPNVFVGLLPPAIADLHAIIATHPQRANQTPLPAPHNLPLPPL